MNLPACTKCGAAPEPGDRFCGHCGAPLAVGPGSPGSPASRAKAGAPAPAARSSGCGCAVAGCLTVLIVGALGVGAAVFFLPEADEILDEVQALLDSGPTTRPARGIPGTPGPARVGSRKAPAEDLATLWRTARDARQPAPARLTAMGALQKAGVSGDEASELEALQEKALSETTTAIERERERRERFTREAAGGAWIREAGASADAVWRAAGGR